MRLGLAALIVTAVPCAAAHVHAQPATEGFGVTGRVERPLVSGAGEDATAAATTVDVEDRPQAFDTLDALLLEVPGAQAWVTGGYGAFSALSLRGAGAEHTTVLLGDLPLGGEGEAFDLSFVPVSLLERVEVYRGGAPIWLGAGNLGGVLRLVPREEDGNTGEVAAGAGSFGLVHGHVATSIGTSDGTSFSAAAGVVHSDGDFPFRYDPTPLVPGDEREVRRDGAGVDEGHGLVRLAVPAPSGALEVAVLGVGRTGGVPGPAIQRSRASRATTRLAAAAAYTAGADPGAATQAWQARLSAGASYGRDALHDRFGDVGFGRARLTDDRTTRAHVLAAGTARALDWLSVATALTVDRESREPRDTLSQTPIPRSTRWSGSAALELRPHGRLGAVRVEARPSVKLRLSRAWLHEIAAGREGRSTEPTRVLPTARLGVVIEPISGLSLTGSVAVETRLPTFVELFGDRAFLLGDTRLRAERAVVADVGALGRGVLGVARGTVELRGFALFAGDLIRYRRTAQSQALPENVARARSLGAEAAVRGQLGDHVGLVSALTFLDARDQELDRALPLRPRWQAYARPSLAVRDLGPLSRITVFGDVTWVDRSFADPHNLVTIEARVLFGAGVVAEVLSGDLRVALTASDLGDARPSDVLGFPMPGRALDLTVTARTDAW